MVNNPDPFDAMEKGFSTYMKRSKYSRKSKVRSNPGSPKKSGTGVRRHSVGNSPWKYLPVNKLALKNIWNGIPNLGKKYSRKAGIKSTLSLPKIKSKRGSIPKNFLFKFPSNGPKPVPPRPATPSPVFVVPPRPTAIPQFIVPPRPRPSLPLPLFTPAPPPPIFTPSPSPPRFAPASPPRFTKPPVPPKPKFTFAPSQNYARPVSPGIPNVSRTKSTSKSCPRTTKQGHPCSNTCTKGDTVCSSHRKQLDSETRKQSQPKASSSYTSASASGRFHSSGIGGLSRSKDGNFQLYGSFEGKQIARGKEGKSCTSFLRRDLIIYAEALGISVGSSWTIAKICEEIRDNLRSRGYM